MITNPDGELHAYLVNVGQADTSVIISPEGRVIVIDATRPDKLVRLLDDLGVDGFVEHLVITHPHVDHYRGGNRLAVEKQVEQATFAPFWHAFGMGPQTYRALVARLEDQGTRTAFLSGYSRWYPDGALTCPGGGGQPELDPDAPYLEMLGPTNGFVRTLEDADIFVTNHLSIITRVVWRRFGIVIGADAQMENWALFDDEHLMEGDCQILRAAHHGSPNGTQWERLNRLGPATVVVSSDPWSGHHLPDLSATAIFTKYDNDSGRMAAISRDTGTIHVRVRQNGSSVLECFGDAAAQTVDLEAGAPLTQSPAATDWLALLNDRLTAI